MKKAILIPILFACIILGCSDDPTTTDTTYGDTCTLTQNYDKKVSFITDGFGYSNLLIDYDVRYAYPGAPFDSTDTIIYHTWLKQKGGSFFLICRAGNFYGVKIGDEGHYVWLKIILPSTESGEYTWGENTDVGKTGVSFTKVYEIDYGGEYLPVSGKTLVRFYNNSNTGYVDSVYGSFCGVLQNSKGERITVHDGKFYFIDPD